MICVAVLFLAGCSNHDSGQSQTTSLQTKTSAQTESEKKMQDASSESNDQLTEVTAERDKKNTDDVDLTIMSSTMVYSEVYHMMVSPEDYIGRTVKMKGQFTVYQDIVNNINYYAVVIADATACCRQGLKFVLDGDYKFPDDYPKDGTEITVTGVFETYEEDGNKYSHLADSKMEIKN